MDKIVIVKLANELTRGVKTFRFDDKTYNESEAVGVLRCALIDANGGKETITYKDMRRNKVQIYEIIEEIVANIVNDGFIGSEFWNTYVDSRNLARGDRNEFVIPANSLFVVSDVAEGVATPRRQRIGKKTVTSINTSVHAIRIYEECALFMAGRIDWVDLCARVARSFSQSIWNDVYTAFNGVTAATTGLNSNYVISGSYSEANLLQLVAHVEAEAGSAVIAGTRTALRKIPESVLADSAKESMHNAGFYGMFNGVPEIALPQRHATGTDNFLLNDSTVYVFGGDQKFIHLVNEGDVTIIDKDFTANADMSIEYTTIMKYGVGVWFNARTFGKYAIV